VRSPYRLSFTFGGLLGPETQVVADAYLRLGDWDGVREEILTANLMRKVRRESTSRYFREIRDRLKGAHEWELPVVAGHEGVRNESTLVLLAITVRYYRLLWEFLVEVLRYKLAGGDYKMLGFEFESFWEQKAERAPEMLEITETSRRKLVQVAYRVLQEGGILPGGREGTIVAPTVPYGLSTRYLAEHDADTLMALLVPDHEIRKLAGDSELKDEH
jgi:hypothetical protein